MLISLICFIQCSDQKVNIKRKKFGDFYIEAFYKNDSIIDGEARIFNSANILISKVNYFNGTKNGLAVNYYPNGSKKDSMNFENGLQHGYVHTYNMRGDLVAKNYYYYGLSAGPQVYYSNKIIKKYFFTDFNKEDLVDCLYDSLGICKVVNYFTTRPRFVKVIQDGDSLLNLLLYLPSPPGLAVQSIVSLQNERQEVKNSFQIEKSRIFIDTLLPLPNKNWFYTVSTHINDSTNSINKLFIEEIKFQ